MKKPNPYSERWRDRVREGAQRSADVLVSLLVEAFHPVNVVDVGCGEGWFRDRFRDAGCAAYGIDGPWVEGPDKVADLTQEFPEWDGSDLAISLEVGEHLPPERAEAFVAYLCSLAPTVVFSAAIPKQGGTGHVNEQWPSYWRDLFAEHGYEGSGALRWFIWDDERIEPWYRQNILVFGELGPFQADGCLSVVHPGIWKVYR